MGRTPFCRKGSAMAVLRHEQEYLVQAFCVRTAPVGRAPGRGTVRTDYGYVTEMISTSRRKAPRVESMRRIDLVDFKGGERLRKGSKLVVICNFPNEQSVRATIDIVETTTAFGGRRPWFLCPDCSRRCRALHACRRSGVRCRLCHGARYSSQLEKAGDRALRRMHRIQREMDWPCGWRCPPKPEGMHYKRYAKLRERHWRAEQIWLPHFALEIGAMTGRNYLTPYLKRLLQQQKALQLQRKRRSKSR